jgi:hypothetical protein
MKAFTWRPGSLAVPFWSLLLAFSALGVGGCCPVQRPSTLGHAAPDRHGAEVHTYHFKFVTDAGGRCAIQSAGVTTSEAGGKIPARTCPGDANCARASKGAGDRVAFASEAPNQKILIVFDPFRMGAFAGNDGKEHALDPRIPTVTGKGYTFNVLATNGDCDPLDPKIIIDP